MGNRAKAARRVLNFRRNRLGSRFAGLAPSAITSVMLWIVVFLQPHDCQASQAAIAGAFSGIIAASFFHQLYTRSVWKSVCEVIDWEKVRSLAREDAAEATGNR